MKKVLFSLTALFLCMNLSCTKDSGLCADATTSTDSNCKVTQDLGINDSLLQIEFQESRFFDQNSGQWVTVAKNEFEAAKVENAVPLYTNSVTTATADAITSASSADSQFNAGSSVKNTIPYIKLKANAGVTYLFRYRKYDMNGAIKYDKMGTATVKGDYAYIPLVNSFFDNQLYTTGTSVGTSYKNLFTITAQSATKTGLAKEVSIVTTATVQNTDYLLTFANDVTNFTLDKRWLLYRKAPNYTAPNDNFGFVVLKDRLGTTEMTDLDVRVVFKDDLKVEMEQMLFEEMPIQLENFKTTGKVVRNRGYSFYTNTITLNSIDDFKHKLYLDDVMLAPDSKKVYQALSFPAGKKFDISLNLDLTTASSYTADPNSKGLQYPLKPVCQLIKGQSYIPWVDEPARDAAKAGTPSRFQAICHLDTNGKVTIDPANNPSGLALTDTWFNFFSYAPDQPDKDRLGHLFGIRHVKFKVSGCYKVQVKATGAAAWSNRTVGATDCGDNSSTKDWAAFSTEKTFTIFDNLSQYDSTLGLRSLLETFRSSSLIYKPDLLWNNERLNGNNIRHVY